MVDDDVGVGSDAFLGFLKAFFFVVLGVAVAGDEADDDFAGFLLVDLGFADISEGK